MRIHIYPEERQTMQGLILFIFSLLLFPFISADASVAANNVRVDESVGSISNNPQDIEVAKSVMAKENKNGSQVNQGDLRQVALPLELSDPKAIEIAKFAVDEENKKLGQTKYGLGKVIKVQYYQVADRRTFLLVITAVESLGGLLADYDVVVREFIADGTKVLVKFEAN